MADNEQELRAAVAACLRDWGAWIGEGSFIRELNEERFERLVDKMMADEGNDGVIRQICQLFHAKHGRYPTFDALGGGMPNLHKPSRHI